MRFLGNLLAAILGTIIALFLILFLFIGIAALVGDDDKIEVKNQSVLTLNLDGVIEDYVPKSDNPFDELLGTNDGKFELAQILNAIENAKTDDKIKGISIELLNTEAGISQMQAIRNKLLDFKTSGKFVTAYSDIYTQKSYYLSSVADSIFVNPVGMVEFSGLSTEKLYFKGFQEKYGVKMEVIRHGKYKSAMEGFISDKMSDANREQTLSFLNSIWGEILDDIAVSRKKSVAELNEIADKLGTSSITLAVQNKMVDKALYADEYELKLKKLSGVAVDKDLERISLADYIESGKGQIISTAKDKIAVLYAQGEISYGKGDESYIGQESMMEALKKLREDKNVKAIVLRINSPGGSALASDLIWREIEITKKVKPIVVSMGDVAASGGYYIACNSNRIFAEPTTITGSIGVFGAIPNMSGLAGNMGINAEQVATNKGANYSAFEPLSTEFHDYIKGSIDEIYQTFIGHVAIGRNMTTAAVDSIGQGRVWTGKEAKEIGLVDELGGLNDAIAYTAKLVKLEKYKLTVYPRYEKDIKDAFSANPFMKAQENKMIEEIGLENYKMYKTIKSYQKMEGVQARLPFEIKIK
jgi:protease IV